MSPGGSLEDHAGHTTRFGMRTSRHIDRKAPISLILLLLSGFLFMSCSAQREYSGNSIKPKLSKLVNEKQEMNRYFLHWRGIQKEVHYATGTNSGFSARLTSAKDMPESIRNYAGLPRESKWPGELDEVHIYLHVSLENPYADKIEVPHKSIRKIVLERHKNAMKGWAVVGKIVGGFIELLIHGELEM